MLLHTEDNIVNPCTVYKKFKVNMKELIKINVKISICSFPNLLFLSLSKGHRSSVLKKIIYVLNSVLVWSMKVCK